MLTDRMKDELIQGLRDIFANNIEAIILYGSVARNESTPESDIDIAVIVKKGMDIETKDRFICWAADMDLRYDRVFSIVDIEKENLQKWGKSFRSIKMSRRRELFFGRQPEGISRIPDGSCKGNAGCSKRKS